MGHCPDPDDSWELSRIVAEGTWRQKTLTKECGLKLRYENLKV